MSYAELGPTHHSCEDMGLLRMLPEMTVLAPCDAVEVRLGLRAALAHDGPVYMRIGKKGEPIVHKTPPDFRIGRAITMREGTDVALISTGNMIGPVFDAADRLAKEGVSARIENFHTVKPLDRERLTELFAKYPVVAVAEEHSRLGGLGGSIAEWLAEQDAPRGRLIAFGTDDVFMHEVGSQDYARAKFGLTGENIAAKVLAKLRTIAR
jgi:transketolase